MKFKQFNKTLIKILNENKRDLKYCKFKVRGDEVFVTGIGYKAIRASINDGEQEYYFHNNWIGQLIGQAMVKTFPNELWNKDVIQRIYNQEKLCEKNGVPNFAPKDGFCWSCGEQIYTRHDGRTHVTGCPHCMKSFCD